MAQCGPAGRPRTCGRRSAGKLTQSTKAREVVYSFLHYVDLLPDSSGRLTQSDRPLGQLQIVCCERHQLYSHGRLSTRLGEPDAPFGQLSMVFGSQHSRTILRSQVPSTKTRADGLNSIKNLVSSFVLAFSEAIFDCNVAPDRETRPLQRLQERHAYRCLGIGRSGTEVADDRHRRAARAPRAATQSPPRRAA
jgi:hypothetical protein